MGVVAHTCNPNTWKVEVGGMLRVWGLSVYNWVLSYLEMHSETLSTKVQKKIIVERISFISGEIK